MLKNWNASHTIAVAAIISFLVIGFTLIGTLDEVCARLSIISDLLIKREESGNEREG